MKAQKREAIGLSSHSWLGVELEIKTPNSGSDYMALHHCTMLPHVRDRGKCKLICDWYSFTQIFHHLKVGRSLH